MNPVTGVLGEAWAMYRRFAAHFLTIAFCIYVPAAIVVGLLDRYAGIAGAAAGGIIHLFAAFLVQAALVKAVQDVRDGRVDLDFGETVSAALPFVLPVAVASILASIGIAIGLGLLIVPGLVLITFWSLIAPAIVIGGAGPLHAFGVSWRTVRGYAWPVFGTYVLVFLIWIACGIVVGLIFVALPVFPRDFLSSAITGTLIAPFLALVVTLLYYRLGEAHAGPAAGPAYGQPPPAGSQPR
jgi:hypothetical protein